jgi:hypothetical protein
VFRYSTIIREIVQSLAKVIFMSKHSVKLRHYLLCGCVAACFKMDLQEVGGGRGDWMELAQDRDGWLALVGTVRNFRVP